MKLGEKFYKDIPCKFTPALVLHVLHFIVDFFYNPRASLARAAFKRDFLVKLKAISFFWSKLRKVKLKGICFKMAFYSRASLAHTVFSFQTFLDPRYRPPTPVVSEKWSESEKWSVFGPLFFLKLIYIIDHIYTFIATRGNCAQQLSYGCKILDKLGVAEKFIKIWLLGWFFQKWSPTCRS